MRERPRRTSQLITRDVVLLSGALALASIAFAFLVTDVSRGHDNPGGINHWFGYDNCRTNSNPCEADNSYHTNCWGNDFNGSGMRDDARYAMRNLTSQTNMTKNRTGCNSTIDIVWRSGVPAGEDPNRLRGLYRCRTLQNSQECEKSQVWINSSLLNGQSQTTLNRRKTSCHEVGHSGGIAHGGYSGNGNQIHFSSHSCMVSGRISSGHQKYNNHQVRHWNFN